MGQVRMVAKDKKTIEDDLQHTIKYGSKFNRHKIAWAYYESTGLHECRIKIRTTYWLLLPFVIYKLMIFPFEAIRNLLSDICSEFGFYKDE